MAWISIASPFGRHFFGKNAEMATLFLSSEITAIFNHRFQSVDVMAVTDIANYPKVADNAVWGPTSDVLWTLTIVTAFRRSGVVP